MRSGPVLFLALVITFCNTKPAAAQDMAAGKQRFDAECTACHSADPGVNGVGPSLAGLAGRKAGSLKGFEFSKALSTSGLTWTADTFDRFLTNPSALVPGTSMAAILSSAADRTNVFAYLQTLKVGDAAPANEPQTKATRIAGPSEAELEAAASSPNWLYATQNYAGTRFAPLRQITPANAAGLRPACIYRSEQAAPTQTNPLVYNGVMYLTFARSTVAIDAATCREIWTHTWQPKGHEISPTNRGGAIKDGKLIRGTADGYLIALDMASGELLWSREIASASTSQYVSAPPLIYKNLVVIGPAGADFGPKNWVGAFKIDSGEPVWKFNLIPDAGEPGAETWDNAEALKHGGGSIWSPLSLDAASGTLYVPVGNPAPDFYGPLRTGANLYTNSIVALSAETGKLVAYKQTGPHDVYDADLSQVSPLMSVVLEGKSTDVIAASGKDGYLRLFDRKLQTQFYQVPITTIKNTSALPTVEGTHRCPGLLGGVEWNGPAYDAASNTLFVAAVDWCGTFKLSAEAPQPAAEAHYYGGAVISDPRAQAKGWLTAFDASTGKEKWKYASETPLVAGLVASAGGMLFTGDLHNDFLALEAATGKVLYRFNTGGTIGGGVVSYEINAKQYVAAASGSVSAFFGGSGIPAVIVFALQ